MWRPPACRASTRTSCWRPRRTNGRGNGGAGARRTRERTPCHPRASRPRAARGGRGVRHLRAAFTLTRHFPSRDAVAYIGAQFAGATLGALTLLAIWTDRPARLGATLPSVGAGSALVYEIVLTAFLMFVIMAVATDTRAVGAAAAIAIGGTVGLDAIFGGPVTGASMNPARSFGPALAAGEWQQFWIYIVGPLAGAALGALAYQLVRGEGTRPG
jgi:glycerol uptake facilitator-like aquaporin